MFSLMAMATTCRLGGAPACRIVFQRWLDVRQTLRCWILWAQPLVKNADKVLGFSEAVLGRTLTKSVTKRTFFKHFCAGKATVPAHNLGSDSVLAGTAVRRYSGICGSLLTSWL